jgi:hypothetical protein
LTPASECGGPTARPPDTPRGALKVLVLRDVFEHRDGVGNEVSGRAGDRVDVDDGERFVARGHELRGATVDLGDTGADPRPATSTSGSSFNEAASLGSRPPVARPAGDVMTKSPVNARSMIVPKDALADAVAAVRLGLRMAFSRASCPLIPQRARQGPADEPAERQGHGSAQRRDAEEHQQHPRAGNQQRVAGRAEQP